MPARPCSRQYRLGLLLLALSCAAWSGTKPGKGPAPRASISFAAKASAQALDGRVYLLLSTDPSDEPRMQINDTPKSQLIFGMDVEGLRPGQPALVDERADGYPIRSLRELPEGDYVAQAVFSPAGADGYPRPIFDKRTGVIDREMAAYWREHYDLRAILDKNWPTLGPSLQGKLHVYCGSADNYFLNNAVYLLEDFLKATTNPPYDGEVKYGDRAEHCWNGDPEQPNHISRLHYHTLYLDKILTRIKASAPAGADLSSWRY